MTLRGLVRRFPLSVYCLLALRCVCRCVGCPGTPFTALWWAAQSCFAGAVSNHGRRTRFGPLTGAFILGVLWGIWHLPVVDALGVASPHGPAWPAFFLAFIAVLVPLRVLIAWIYNHTESVLLAQLAHASSTGFLVVLGAPRVSPAQEALWYALYAAALWIVIGVILTIQSRVA